MDAFGWSAHYAADPCLRSPPNGDGLLGALMMSFHDGLPSDHGSLDLPSSHSMPSNVNCHGGTSLSDGGPAAFVTVLDTAAVLPTGVTGGAADDVLLFDSFVYVPNVAEAGAQATVSNSNTVFSGYNSSATGGNGGNISSGESNTCDGGGGGHDIEVASPCAASAASKRKLDKYPAAPCASATTAAAAERRGAKRAAATSSSTSITFGGQTMTSHHNQAAAAGTTTPLGGGYEPDAEAMAQVKEMIYRAAAMRPVHQLVARAPSSRTSCSRPRRKNVRISSDPQTVAARLRRERVSERLRVLQRLVPGGARMDTASMLDEAASYLKFLKSQLAALECGGGHCSGSPLQNYTGNLGGSGTVLAFGSRDGIGGYVKSNRNMMPL